MAAAADAAGPLSRVSDRFNVIGGVLINLRQGKQRAAVSLLVVSSRGSGLDTH